MSKNKALSFILSLVVAFGLWLYVVTVISPQSEETFRNIEVTLQNDVLLRERGLMIVSNKTPTVTLRISGNRTDLAKLSAENITITADVSKIYEAGERTLNYSYSFPGDVSQSAFTIEERYPANIVLEVENRISKSVDVRVNYKGSLPENYIYDKENVTLDNPQITVTGPESVIEQITHALVEINLDGRTESFSEELVYTLCNAADEPVDVAMVSTNVESVNLLLMIHRVKEIPLVVAVEAGGGATEQTSSITVEPATIRVSGSEAQLEGLEQIQIGTVQLGKILKDTQLNFDIVVPEDVVNETGITQATVDIKFPSLKTRTLTVTNIRPVNVPASMELDMITEALEITVRGPIELVDSLKETDVTVLVDFSNASIGTATASAQISFGTTFAEVGIMGDYTVSATLTQKDTKGGA